MVYSNVPADGPIEATGFQTSIDNIIENEAELSLIEEIGILPDIAYGGADNQVGGIIYLPIQYLMNTYGNSNTFYQYSSFSDLYVAPYTIPDTNACVLAALSTIFYNNGISGVGSWTNYYNDVKYNASNVLGLYNTYYGVIYTNIPTIISQVFYYWGTQGWSHSFTSGSTNVWNQGKSQISAYHPVLIGIDSSSSAYANHAVVGYGWSIYKNVSTGTAYNFFRVRDGWTTSSTTRYFHAGAGSSEYLVSVYPW